MERDAENALRVATLCKRLGSMWSVEDEAVVFEEIPESLKEGCELTIFGKILARSNVNFHAFQSTMRKVWKVEQVEAAVIEPGYFSFQSKSEEDKNKVVTEGPWCFSCDLLVLKQCEPDIPDHCYEFSTCAFWVQLKGIPRGRMSEEIVRCVTSKIGYVTEVKMETKGNNPTPLAKARIILDVEAPLKSGTFLNLGYKKIWIDFKYERLPMFCHSCGYMGHYTTACEKVPFAEKESHEEKKSDYGGWLRVEVRVPSPFWQLFYGKEVLEYGDEEMGKDVSTQKVNEDCTSHELSCLTKEVIKGKNKMECQLKNGKRTGIKKVRNSRAQLMITDTNDTPASVHARTKGAGPIVPMKKKLKRAANSDLDEALKLNSADGNLHETPILQIKEGNEWALVASPNKPLEII